jgi:hypothetical protein
MRYPVLGFDSWLNGLFSARRDSTGILFAFTAKVFFVQKAIFAQEPQMIFDLMPVPLNCFAGEALSQQFPTKNLPNLGVYDAVSKVIQMT